MEGGIDGDGRGGDEAVEFGEEGGEEGEEEREGEEVAVEEVFVPVGAVGGVGKLGVESHDCREQLRESEDHEPGDERGVDARGAAGGCRFALRNGWV